MSFAGRFEFLEHTADAYVAAYGKDLAEAFENGALAMFQVMTDVKKVAPKSRDQVEVTAKDDHSLLYNWLEALLVKFDTQTMLFSRFKIHAITETPEELKLEAEAWGERFNPGKHAQKVGVKAITYHRMEIIRKPQKVTLKFILDI